MTLPAVRRATDADLEALAAMGAALAAWHHEIDPERFFFQPGFAEGYRWWFTRELARDEVFLGVVDGDAGPVGYLYGALEEKDWNKLLEAHAALVDVFVVPSARGGGAGEALVAAFCAWAESRGAPRVVLSTASQNAGAQRFFARMGFRATMVEMTREAAGSRAAR